MARRDRGGGDGDGERAEAVLAGAQRTAPPGNARRRRAGRGVGRAGGAVEVPVVSAHGGRLQGGVVYEDLRGPLGHRRRRVGQRVAGRWRRRARQGPVEGGAIVGRQARLVPGKRGGQPRRNRWRAVGPGAQLEHRETDQSWVRTTRIRQRRETDRSGSGTGNTEFIQSMDEMINMFFLHRKLFFCTEEYFKIWSVKLRHSEGRG